MDSVTHSRPAMKQGMTSATAQGPGSRVFLSMALWMLVALGLRPADAIAQEIYRWVDETGRTHMSDTVPDRFKSSAKRYDSRQYQQTEEQKRQAVIDTRQAAEALKPAKPQHPVTEPVPTTDPEPQDVSPGQSATAPDTTDCEALRQEFRIAQECFAQYRTYTWGIGSRIRGEAFQNCPDLPAPPPRCGIERLKR